MSTYRGIAFPFRKGSASFPEKSEDAQVIKDSISQIMLTGRGERIMRPNFGSGVYGLVFENNDETLVQIMRAEVIGAIGKFEPRVIIREVNIEREDSMIVVTVTYVIRLSGTTDVLQVEIPGNTEVS